MVFDHNHHNRSRRGSSKIVENGLSRCRQQVPPDTVNNSNIKSTAQSNNTNHANNNNNINWELNEKVSLSSASSVKLDNGDAMKKENCNPGSETVGTPVQRRWTAANLRLDKTNDALSKRMRIVEELNRQIAASQEKIQNRLRKSDKPNTVRKKKLNYFLG